MQIKGVSFQKKIVLLHWWKVLIIWLYHLHCKLLVSENWPSYRVSIGDVSSVSHLSGQIKGLGGVSGL